MKKTLLATTSIVAVGLGASAAQAQWDVNVGGFINQWFVFNAHQNVEGYNGTHVNGNTEVHFTGRNTLDNGLTVGFKVELEGDAFGTGAIDESVLFVSSPDYGRFEIGMEDGAGIRMNLGGPSVGFAANSGTWTDFLVAPSLAAAAVGLGYCDPGYTTICGETGDSPKITYFTPRVSGFQFGVSYTPDPGAGGNNRTFIGVGAAPAVGNGVNHWTEVAINYTETFGPVDVGAYAGLNWAESKPGNMTGQDAFMGLTSAVSTTEDFLAWGAGGNVSWAGFTFGGSYFKVEEGLRGLAVPTGGAAPGVVVTNEGDGFEVGLSYGQGPWSFGVQYFQGVSEGYIVVPGNYMTRAITGGVSYDLAPGVTLLGSVGYTDFDSELDFGGAAIAPLGGSAVVTTTAAATEADNSGVYIGTGIALSF